MFGAYNNQVCGTRLMLTCTVVFTIVLQSKFRIADGNPCFVFEEKAPIYTIHFTLPNNNICACQEIHIGGIVVEPFHGITTETMNKEHNINEAMGILRQKQQECKPMEGHTATTTSESTTSELTTSESTTTDFTTSEPNISASTTSESNTTEVNTSESTTSETTTSEFTTSESVTSELTTSETSMSESTRSTPTLSTRPKPITSTISSEALTTSEQICTIAPMNVCNDTLGMEDNTILDSQLSASYWFGSGSEAHNARLNHNWGWGTIDANDTWIQVDLNTPMRVSGVVIQGMATQSYWLTEFKVQYGTVAGSLNQFVMADDQSHMVFQGNSDGNTPVARMFPEPVMARFITIFPTAWHLNIGLRFELLGCTTGTCESGWLAQTTHCYYFSTNTETFSAARQECCIKGAELTSIHNLEEQRFIKDHDTSSTWIGLTGDGNGGTWAWTDGSEVDFHNWHGDEPQPDFGLYCVLAGMNGRWRVEECENKNAYVCKK